MALSSFGKILTVLDLFSVSRPIINVDHHQCRTGAITAHQLSLFKGIGISQDFYSA